MRPVERVTALTEEVADPEEPEPTTTLEVISLKNRYGPPNRIARLIFEMDQGRMVEESELSPWQERGR